VAVEVGPGVWTALFRDLEKQAVGKGKVLLTLLATAIETQAKTNASVGSHRYGTKTPASPGTGPAVISGTLRRSITHEPVTELGSGHWRTRVGTGVGFTPSYGGQHRTPANKYGYYLEHALRNGSKYPFLVPAFKHVTGIGAGAMFRLVYGETAWKRVY
jgi:hypothetical protein